MRVIKEILGIQPTGLKKVGKVEGIPIYSSPTLKRQFLKAVQNQPKTSLVYDDIVKLVGEEIVVPCYVSKNVLSYVKHALFGSSFSKNTGSFYSPETKKVYMVFDNNVEWLVWASDRWLSQILIHELMHCAAGRIPRSQYFNLFKDDLSTYYAESYSKFFGHKFTKSDGYNIARTLYMKIDTESELVAFTTLIRKLDKFLRSEFGTKTPEIDSKIPDFIRGAKTFFNKDYSLYIKMYRRKREPVWSFFNALVEGYRSLGLVKIPKFSMFGKIFVGQESIFVSEVMAVSTLEKTTSKHFQAVKMIAETVR